MGSICQTCINMVKGVLYNILQNCIPYMSHVERVNAETSLKCENINNANKVMTIIVLFGDTFLPAQNVMKSQQKNEGITRPGVFKFEHFKG